ncbi:MAG: GxxExxY protein [Acidobacteriota bacterium]|jgi:GxxExxY protein
MEHELKHAKTTDLLLHAFYQVYSELGYGFLERVYENSMVIAARKLGVHTERQVPIRVHYQGEVVGEYAADLVADNAVIVELKAARAITPENEAQLLNYLKATPYEVGLLLNFGAKPEFKRKAYENSRKGSLSWCKP